MKDDFFADLLVMGESLFSVGLLLSVRLLEESRGHFSVEPAGRTREGASPIAVMGV
jgi:hypothetical protein